MNDDMLTSLKLLQSLTILCVQVTSERRHVETLAGRVDHPGSLGTEASFHLRPEDLGRSSSQTELRGEFPLPGASAAVC